MTSHFFPSLMASFMKAAMSALTNCTSTSFNAAFRRPNPRAPAEVTRPSARTCNRVSVI